MFKSFTAITAALRRVGGYGKTTLAKAICHNEQIQEEFYDGVLWVTLGEKPGDLVLYVEDMIRILSGEPSGLSSLDATTARSTAESARMCDYPINNHNVLTLLGVIALRQGDCASANEAFKAAVVASDILLDHSDTNYEALDAKGFALCEGKSDYIEEAIHVYTKARSITRAPGIVGRVLRSFDELATPTLYLYYLTEKHFRE